MIDWEIYIGKRPSESGSGEQEYIYEIPSTDGLMGAELCPKAQMYGNLVQVSSKMAENKDCCGESGYAFGDIISLWGLKANLQGQGPSG